MTERRPRSAEEIHQVLAEELPADYPLEDRLTLEAGLLRQEIEDRERQIRILGAELKREREIDELEEMFAAE